MRGILEERTLFKNWEKYRGSIVMVVGEKIFATKRANKVGGMIETIEKKFHKRPLITYIPKGYGIFTQREAYC